MTGKDIKEDVAKADASETAIVRLHVATTAPTHANLTRFVNNLSDERAVQGIFRVAIDCRPEIVGHFRRNPSLHEKYEPTAPGADGDVFLDALRQGDNRPADLLLEVRWIRKRYLDAPIWTERIVAKVKSYELMTGRKASGILTLVVPDKLGTIDLLHITRDAVAAADRPIQAVIATYAALGYDPGAVSAAVFASNSKWGATRIEIDLNRPGFAGGSEP